MTVAVAMACNPAFVVVAFANTLIESSPVFVLGITLVAVRTLPFVALAVLIRHISRLGFLGVLVAVAGVLLASDTVILARLADEPLEGFSLFLVPCYLTFGVVAYAGVEILARRVAGRNPRRKGTLS